MPGHNLNQTRWRFENQIAPFDPDLVILYLGWNDLGYIVSEDPQAEPFHKRPVASTLTRAANRSTLYGLIAYRLIGGRSTLSAETLTATKPSAAGGKLFIPQNDGKIHVIQAGRSFRKLATNHMREQTMASPAVSNGNLYIRTRRHIYCIANTD